MTTRLYLTPLPNTQTTDPPSQAVQSNVALAGLLEEGGVATENIATEGIDLTLTGQWRYGSEFSKKIAKELNSLSESTYTGLPLYDSDGDELEDQRGYYELQTADTNPAHKTSDQAQQYNATLTATGTRATHWRAVSTSEETISTGLATGSSGLIGVPSDDRKERWFDPAQGSELATPTKTVDAEFGDVDLFDPANSTFTDPTLLFEQPYESEGLVDVRVWDDRDLPKYAEFEADGDTVSTSTLVGSATVSGTTRVVQWHHAFHSAFEFEGSAVVDNGLIRLRFDEGNSVLRAQEWDGTDWVGISIRHTDFVLFDADVTRVGPADVEVYAEFKDTTADTIHGVVFSVQRGLTRAVIRQPDNGTIPNGLETMLDPIASDQTTDRQPNQNLKSRGEVK